MFRPAIVVAVIASVACSAPLHADLVSVGASKDNTLYQDPTGSLSNGAGDNFFVGRTNQGSNSIRRGLLAFDVAAFIPAGSTIDSVTLTLHLSSANSADQGIGLHRALADWGEGTSAPATGSGGSGAPATAGDATWIHTFYDGATWSSPGGDFAATASAVTTVGGLSGDPLMDYFQWTSAAMVADVQAWLDGPSANFGWAVLGNETVGGTSKRFDTREDTRAEYRPVLMIEYTVPAPGAAVVLAVLGVRRRRRGNA